MYDPDYGGWIAMGGTSVASPIIAATFALAGSPGAGTYPASYLYADTADLDDVIGGNNNVTGQSCTVTYLCNGVTGYDGPTGLGTPNGVTAFMAGPHLAVSGLPSPTVAGVAHNLTVTAKDASGNTATGYTGTVHFTSSDPAAVLPADATLTNGVGTFSVTLKTAGTQSVRHGYRHRHALDHRQPRAPSWSTRDPPPRSPYPASRARPSQARPITSRSQPRTHTATPPPATPGPSTSPALIPPPSCRRMRP